MSRLHVGLPPTKLLLRLTEQLLAQHIFPVESTFISQSSTGGRACAARLFFLLFFSPVQQTTSEIGHRVK